MPLRNYANAQATTLTQACSGSDTVVTVAQTVSFPNAPFTLILDYGAPTEEVVTCTLKNGLNLTVTRGQDFTTAFPHSVGAVVAHGVSARDHRENNAHVNATSGIHGVSGSLVGTTDTQTLTNKTLTAPQINNGVANSLAMRPGVGDIPLRVQNTDGTVDLMKVLGTGSVQASGLFLTDDAGSTPTMRLTGSASQTQNLTEWRDSASALLARVTSNGSVVAPNLTPNTNPAGLYATYTKSDIDNVPDTTWTVGSFWVTSAGGGFTYSSGTWTLPFDGLYTAYGQCWFDSGTVGRRGLRIIAGSTCVGQELGAASSGGGGLARNVTATWNGTAGQVIRLEAYQSSGSSLATWAAANGDTANAARFHIRWICPAQA